MERTSLITRFMETTSGWGPYRADRTQVDPMLAPWTLLSGLVQLSPLYTVLSPAKVYISTFFDHFQQKHFPIQWRHNERDGVSNRRLDCLPNHLIGRRSNKISKLRVTGPCKGISLVTGEFPALRTSNAENVSIWWRHHAIYWDSLLLTTTTPMKIDALTPLACGDRVIAV